MRPERVNTDDSDVFHVFTPVEQENIWVLLPGLVEGTSILLDYGGLLRVDDGGGGHDNGSTFTWRGLMKQEKLEMYFFKFVISFKCIYCQTISTTYVMTYVPLKGRGAFFVFLLRWLHILVLEKNTAEH